MARKSPEEVLFNASKLVFSSDNQPGITRRKSGKKFTYFLGSKLISNKNVNSRINSLVIPPAWREVWICRNPQGHLQATGLDARNRKQYIYHPHWSEIRNEQKFDKLHEFGNALPAIRRQIEKDMHGKKFSQEKVLATAIGLMERTYIRVGNSIYERENNSYGITTLKDRHVSINGHELKLSFTGKKGIHHSISVKSKRLARIVKQCRSIPGKELFQYFDEDGNTHPIDSGMLNDYIRKISKSDFTAKDFRTWAGSLHMFQAFKGLSESSGKNSIQKNIVRALEYVSLKLGNTKTVCRKYYVHPILISMYENKTLQPFLNPKNKSQNSETVKLSSDERMLMKILRSGRRRIRKAA